jgi:hypothetical protein
MDLAAGIYLSEAPSPPLHYTLYKYVHTPVLTHTGKGRGGSQPVRRLVYKRGRKYKHDALYRQ